MLEQTNNNQNNLIEINQYMEFAKLMADSDIVPRDYKGKPGNIIVAIQMGNELGLKPIQSLQNISVINGRPSIWGDALLSLIQGRPDLESFKEWTEGSIESGDAIAYCLIKRRGMDEVVEYFDIKKATRAGLLKKPGPWQQYPERMLQMRARGFAIRNAFADVTKGIILAEEARDIPSDTHEIKDVTPPKESISKVESLKQSLLEKKESTQIATEFTYEELAKGIASAKNHDDLMQQADVIKDVDLSDDEKKKLRAYFNEQMKAFKEKDK